MLYRALALTIGLFLLLLVGMEILLSQALRLPWAWAETLAAFGSGLLLLALFFFLMVPVAAIFAGLYLDRIAGIVEARHYGRDPPGTPLSNFQALRTALQYSLIILLVNLAVLPLIFTGIGALALVAANAYLLSREYFEMVAMRHMKVDDARRLRRENSPAVLAAGFIPAVLSLVPVANMLVPLFATSYFVHIFKRLPTSSE